MITFLTVTKRIASGDEDMDGSEASVETALDLVPSDEEETFEKNSASNKKKLKGNRISCKTNRGNKFKIGSETDISRQKKYINKDHYIASCKK